MLRLKPGVRLTDLAPQMAVVLEVVPQAYREAGARDCTITSANDGKHKVGSLHYSGRALDFRTRDLDELGIDVLVLLVAIRDALGENFDCLLEDRYGSNEHLHVEYDPEE